MAKFQLYSKLNYTYFDWRPQPLDPKDFGEGIVDVKWTGAMPIQENVAQGIRYFRLEFTMDIDRIIPNAMNTPRKFTVMGKDTAKDLQVRRGDEVPLKWKGTIQVSALAAAYVGPYENWKEGDKRIIDLVLIDYEVTNPHSCYIYDLNEYKQFIPGFSDRSFKEKIEYPTEANFGLSANDLLVAKGSIEYLGIEF